LRIAVQGTISEAAEEAFGNLCPFLRGAVLNAQEAFGVNLMHEFFQQLEQLRHLDQRVTLATLVNTLGTSPRKEGAKMWVEEGGDILGSVTIGGCVDAYVIEQSEAVLAEHAPRLIELPLGDEDAWDLGLSCAGTIEVFIEPLSPDQSQTFDFYAALQSHITRSASGALLTCLDGAAIGAKLLLLDDGNTLGSLGDPRLDQEVCQVALSHINQGFSRTVSVDLPHKTVRVFVEVYTPPATLIIVGASHVAMVLAQLARPAGFQTVVVDSRPRFATPERFPDTDKLLVGIPSEIVQTLPMSSVTAVILVAHDYKYDLPILRHVLSSPTGYIGVLGSRRRGEGLLKFLQEEGIAEEALQRIRVPIGLDLGGQTAPEIALAILAEVVSARYGGSHLPLSQQRKRAE
jgi:xanthine dehydrogenase accessory factor